MSHQSSRITTVLFDLDGTLIDSIPDITAALNQMRKIYHLEPVKQETVKDIVGKGFPTTVKKVLSLDLPANEIEKIFTDAYQHTLDAYTTCMGKYTTIFPGVIETIKSLHNLNIKMAIVTNKEETHAKETVKHTGINKYIDLIIGGNTTTHYKPHPEPLYYAMKKLGSTPLETIMVGDSESDISAAKSASVRSVAVTYGYNHGKPISQSQPNEIINSISELLHLLD